VCADRLTRLPAPPGPGALVCPAGHRFDIARQGQVSLLAAPLRFTGDDGQMIAARADFLAAGHFAGLRDAAAAAIADHLTGADPLTVELGAGTGYHLTGIVKTVGGRGIALDVSKAAARRAARAHRDVAAIIADAWSTWPVADAAVGVVVSVFAPRNPAETARVLRPGGLAVVVAPDAAHLGELAGPLGLIGVDADKTRRLEDGLGAVLDPVTTIPVRYEAAMTRDHAGLAAAMGPSAHHGGDRTAALEALPAEVTVTVSAQVSIFRARP